MLSSFKEASDTTISSDEASPQHRKLSYLEFYKVLKSTLCSNIKQNEPIHDYLDINISTIFNSLFDIWSVIRFESYKSLLELRDFLPIEFRRKLIIELYSKLELNVSWQILHGSLLGLQAILIECNSDLEVILIRLLGNPRLPVRESARGCLSIVEYSKDHNRFVYLILSSIAECVQNDERDCSEASAFKLDGLLSCVSDILHSDINMLLNHFVQEANSDMKTLFNVLIETLESAISHKSSVVRQRAGAVVLLLCKTHLDLFLKSSDKHQYDELLHNQLIFLIHWISKCVSSAINWKVQEGFYIVSTEILRLMLFRRLEDLATGNSQDVFEGIILPLLAATQDSLASSLSHEVFEIRRVSAQLLPVLVRATLLFNINNTLLPLVSLSSKFTNKINILLPEVLAAASWVSELIKASQQIEEGVFYQLAGNITESSSSSSSLLLLGKLSASKSHVGAEDERTKFGVYLKSIASQYGSCHNHNKYLSRPHSHIEETSSTFHIPSDSPLIMLQQQVRSYLTVILNTLGTISTYLTENKLHSVDVTEAMVLTLSYYINCQLSQYGRIDSGCDNVYDISNINHTGPLNDGNTRTTLDLEMESRKWMWNVLVVQGAVDKTTKLACIIRSTGALLGMRSDDWLVDTTPSVTEPSSRRNMMNERTYSNKAMLTESYSFYNSPEISPIKILSSLPTPPPPSLIPNSKISYDTINTSTTTTSITPERKISDNELREAIALDRWLCEALCYPLLNFSKVYGGSSPYYLTILVIASRWRYYASTDPRWLDGRPNALKFLSSTIAMASEKLFTNCINELDDIIDLEELAERRSILLGIADIILKVMVVVKISEKTCTTNLVKALYNLLKFVKALDKIIIGKNESENNVLDVSDPFYYESWNQLIKEIKDWIASSHIHTHYTSNSNTSRDFAMVIDFQDVDSILTTLPPPPPPTLAATTTITTAMTAMTSPQSSDEFSDWDDDESEEDNNADETAVALVNNNLIFPFTTSLGMTGTTAIAVTSNSDNITGNSTINGHNPPDKYMLLKQALEELRNFILELE